MNIKRGRFRCWIVFSLAVALLTAVVTYHSVSSEFRKAALIREMERTSIALIPIVKGNARGDTKDYNCDGDDPANSFNTCWYQIPKFRELFPEYRDLTDDDLLEKTYRKMGQPRTPARPWSALVEALAFGLGMPLAVLIVGGSLYWAIAGFVPKSAARN